MKDIQVVAKENNLSTESAQTMQGIFAPYFDEAKKASEAARKIVVTSENQTDLMKQAREQRLNLKNIRVEVEKRRREMKDESLRFGRAVDGMANIIKFLVVPIEEHLQLQEDFIKIQEEKRLDALETKRISELEKYEIDAFEYDLRKMSDTAYRQLLSNSKTAFEHRKEQERKAEQERIEEERKRIAEEKRIREENEKLRKEAQEREKLEKIETEKRAKKEAEIQKKLKAEEEKRLKAERELREKKVAEEKDRRETEEKQRQEELERLRAEKEARLAPDKEKMRNLYKALHDFRLGAGGINDYIFTTEEAQAIADEAKKGMDQVMRTIAERMKKI